MKLTESIIYLCLIAAAFFFCPPLPTAIVVAAFVLADAYCFVNGYGNAVFFSIRNGEDVAAWEAKTGVKWSKELQKSLED